MNETLTTFCPNQKNKEKKILIYQQIQKYDHLHKENEGTPKSHLILNLDITF